MFPEQEEGEGQRLLASTMPGSRGNTIFHVITFSGDVARSLACVSRPLFPRVSLLRGIIKSPTFCSIKDLGDRTHSFKRVTRSLRERNASLIKG